MNNCAVGIISRKRMIHRLTQIKDGGGKWVRESIGRKYSTYGAVCDTGFQPVRGPL